MSRQRNPKGAIASGFGLLAAYPIWQWMRGLNQFQQLYGDNASQELVWTVIVLVIVAFVIGGCIYAVLSWIEAALK